MMLQDLQTIFPESRIKTAPEDLTTYGKDRTHYFDNKAAAIVFPESAEELQKLVRWARSKKIGLVPSGGRTGLSGGACALNGEVVVALEKMNKILQFNAVDQTVLVQAGVITEDLQEFAVSKGLFYPVDFAAVGFSQIGGNIATNAGGIKVVRYGMTRDWIAGLKVVTGTGEILELNQALVKNATGYDLRQLYIGSEGTLGFITEAWVRLSPPPPKLKVIFLGVASLSAVMRAFAEFRKSLTLTAFEMLSDKALHHVVGSTGLANPLGSACPYYIVCEVECPTADHEDKIMQALDALMSADLVLDVAISQTPAQTRDFWRLREGVSESLSKYSPYKNDLAVRISKVPDLIEELAPILAQAYPRWEVVWFGHIGDGNLHINILRPNGMSKEDFVRECRSVDELVFTAVQKLDGSISAEHGVGLTKKSFLHFTRSAAEIALMKQIKNAFDPDGIMNPGKVF